MVFFEGNYQEYESDHRKRLEAADEDPDHPHRIKYKRLKRVFEFDITLCPRCGGRLRVIADVTDPVVIRKILDHIHQRAPPVWRSTPE